MRPADSRRSVLATPDGAEIAYRVRPGGDPWVLVHGLGCDASMWDDVIARLPGDVGFLVPEIRGHGDSTLGWRPSSVDLWAEDVVRLIEAEGLERPAIGGLSMGGYTALGVAAAAPTLARAYAFVSTSAHPDDAAGRLRRAAALGVIRRSGWRAFADTLVPALVAPQHPDADALRARLLDSFGRAGDAGLVPALAALANRPDRREMLTAISVPAVVVLGDADALIPAERGREMAAALPRGVLALLQGVGHMSAMESPGEVARALVAVDRPS